MKLIPTFEVKDEKRFTIQLAVLSVNLVSIIRNGFINRYCT